jgi:hypothetical protein
VSSVFESHSKKKRLVSISVNTMNAPIHHRRGPSLRDQG